jgi:hypothetical protein
MYLLVAYKKRASADTRNGHRLRLFALHRGFNLVAKIDTYPHSNGGRLPYGKTYGGTFLRGSGSEKTVIFDLYPDSKPHPQTALRNNGDKQRLRHENSVCSHECSGGTGHCTFVFRPCLRRMPTHPSIYGCGS